MPIPVPTPDEFAAMSWRQRQQAAATARKLLQAITDTDALQATVSRKGQQPKPRGASPARRPISAVQREAQRLERERQKSGP